MPACEQNILDIAVSAAVPDANDMVLFTSSGGVSVLRKWSTMQNGALPPDEQYVAEASGDPTNRVVQGVASFTLITFINRRVRLYRGGILQPTVSVDGGNYYTFDMATGLFTVSPLPGIKEIFQIQAY